MTCKTNTKPCACTYPGCPRHGHCCQCIEYHNQKGQFPGCQFSEEGEKLWDRSFTALVTDRKKKDHSEKSF